MPSVFRRFWKTPIIFPKGAPDWQSTKNRKRTRNGRTTKPIWQKETDTLRQAKRPTSVTKDQTASKSKATDTIRKDKRKYTEKTQANTKPTHSKETTLQRGKQHGEENKQQSSNTKTNNEQDTDWQYKQVTDKRTPDKRNEQATDENHANK